MGGEILSYYFGLGDGRNYITVTLPDDNEVIQAVYLMRMPTGLLNSYEVIELMTGEEMIGAMKLSNRFIEIEKQTTKRKELNMKKLLTLVLLSISCVCQGEDAAIVFTNVKVWDGYASELTGLTTVPHKRRFKSQVSAIDEVEGARVIDGGGRTLMPGLIDAHVHINYQFLDSTPGCADRLMR